MGLCVLIWLPIVTAGMRGWAVSQLGSPVGVRSNAKSSVPPFSKIKWNTSQKMLIEILPVLRERNLHETYCLFQRFTFFFWVTEMSGFTWLYIYIYCWGLFPLQASSEETILEEEIIREANSQLLSLKNIGQMTNPLQHLAHYLWAGNFNREMTLCKSCWSCMKVLFLLKLKDHNDRQTKMNFCAFSLSWW